MDTLRNTPFGPGNASTGQRVTADLGRNTVLDDADCPSKQTGCGNFEFAFLGANTLHIDAGFSRTECAELCNDHQSCTGFIMDDIHTLPLTHGTCVLTGNPECTPDEGDFTEYLYYKLEDCALGMKISIQQLPY